MDLKSYWMLCLMTLVNGLPECKYTDEKRTLMVCTSSDESYVLSRGLVSDNNRTTAVTLRACRITDVELEAFENMAALKYIDLSQNNIAKLELGVLDGVSGVTFLNLSHNSLIEFPLGLFDQLPNLERLELDGNRMENLELGVLDPLEKLKYLSISDNVLRGKALNPYIFDKNTRIAHLDLSRNDMDDAPDIFLKAFEVLEILILDKCFLSKVPGFAVKINLRSLKKLSLSSNHISRVDDPAVFVNLDNLRALDLSDNGIAKISEDVFKPLKKLQVISLRGNRLTILQETLFQNMRSLANIDLSRNLITTVNVNTFHGTSVKNLNLANNKITYLINNFCLELKNFGAKLTKFYFNQNPWQCACLKEILDEVKRFGIAYNSNSYDGAHPVCVTTEEFQCKRHDRFNSVYIEMYDDLILNA